MIEIIFILSYTSTLDQGRYYLDIEILLKETLVKKEGSGSIENTELHRTEN